MSSRRAAWSCGVAMMVACGGEITIGEVISDPEIEEDGDVDDTVDDAPDELVEDDEPEAPDPYAGAALVVYEPAPASIHGDELYVSAEVVDAAGLSLDFEEIQWIVVGQGVPFFTGVEGDVALDYGIYDIAAQVDLPNGDRLRHTIGGVRLQHRYAGVYVGELLMSTFTEVQGQTIRSDCVGSLDFTVAVDGQTMSGDGGCTLSLPLVGTLDVRYDVDGNIDEGPIAGAVALDAVVVDLPIDWTGAFVGDDQVEGSFGGDLLVFDLEGTIGGRRVTRYVE